MSFDRDAFKALAIHGDASLANVKAFLQAQGFALPMEGARARAWCEQEAATGDPQASYVAAEMFHLGLFGSMDQERALELCTAASDAGVAPALLLLAALREKLGEVDAVELMERSANQGYPPAMYAAALKHIVDGTTQREREVGLQYLRRAARAPYAPAQATLAMHLLEAGGELEVQEGVDLLRKAADQGLSHAFRMLAHFFQAGRYGHEMDTDRASRFRSEADRIDEESLATWGVSN